MLDDEPFDDLPGADYPTDHSADSAAWWMALALAVTIGLVLTRHTAPGESQVLGLAVVGGCLYMARVCDQ